MSKDETLLIKRDKVYSSYYARACRIVPNKRLVAISIGIPDNFLGEIMRELNPPEKLLFDFKNGVCSENEYIDRYTTSILDNLNPMDIYNRLKGKVILCYCGKDKFCHRHIVINWLKSHLGEEYIGGEL